MHREDKVEGKVKPNVKHHSDGRCAQRLGDATNNVAEYNGALSCLKDAYIRRPPRWLIQNFNGLDAGSPAAPSRVAMISAVIARLLQ